MCFDKIGQMNKAPHDIRGGPVYLLSDVPVRVRYPAGVRMSRPLDEALGFGAGAGAGAGTGAGAGAGAGAAEPSAAVAQPLQLDSQLLQRLPNSPRRP